MFRHLLKSKIHRTAITHCELHDEGSCAIDDELREAADIREDEPLHIWNIANGDRLVSDAIGAERGSDIVSLDGSVARRTAVSVRGDAR